MISMLIGMGVSSVVGKCLLQTIIQRQDLTEFSLVGDGGGSPISQTFAHFPPQIFISPQQSFISPLNKKFPCYNLIKTCSCTNFVINVQYLQNVVPCFEKV